MRVGVGTSLEEASPAFMQHVLPLVDVVELIPDTLAVKAAGEKPIIPPATLELLAEVARRARIVVHGVGLSIGSLPCWNDDYFRLLDQVLDAVPVAWHSEHLGFVNVDGRFVGTMLSLPRTEEALDLVTARVQRLRERYPIDFLLENIVNLLPDPPAEMSEAAFLNALVQRSGCGVLLDVYNLECNAHNQCYRISDFLDELELTAVREIHVAGGIRHAGLMLDVHSRATHASTRTLLPEVLRRTPRVEAVVYELMPEAIPVLGYPAWADELRFLKTLVTRDEPGDIPTRPAKPNQPRALRRV